MTNKIVLKKDQAKEVVIDLTQTSKRNMFVNTDEKKKQKTQPKKLYNDDGDVVVGRAENKGKINSSLHQRRLNNLADTVTINAYD